MVTLSTEVVICTKNIDSAQKFKNNGKRYNLISGAE